MLGTALFRDSDLYEMYNGRRLQAHLHPALPDDKSVPPLDESFMLRPAPPATGDGVCRLPGDVGYTTRRNTVPES